jgi:hypothetical protein
VTLSSWHNPELGRSVRRAARRLKRRSRQVACSLAAEISASPAGDLAHTRMIELADAQEAELFGVAFHRYAELHGRVVSDPSSHCALTAVSGLVPARPMRLAVFWSRRAAREFDRFWTCYRRVYGPGADDVLAPVG